MPKLRALAAGKAAAVFAAEPGYVGLDTYDVLHQHVVSHMRYGDGRDAELFRSPHRYIWPAELDLMAPLAGFHQETRHADWNGTELHRRVPLARLRVPPPTGADPART